MNQTFIDMLVAIKDPVAIEKAYNIMAAKRELLVVGAGKGVGKSAFQHSVMEPRPVPKTYSQESLEQEQSRQKELRERGLPLITTGDTVALKGATPSMQAQGFYNGQRFRIIRRHRHKQATHVVAQCLVSFKFATIHVDYIKRVHV